MTGKQKFKRFHIGVFGDVERFWSICYGHVSSYFTGNVGFLPDYIFKSAVRAYYEYGGAGDRTIGFWSVK